MPPVTEDQLKEAVNTTVKETIKEEKEAQMKEAGFFGRNLRKRPVATIAAVTTGSALLATGMVEGAKALYHKVTDDAPGQEQLAAALTGRRIGTSFRRR